MEATGLEDSNTWLYAKLFISIIAYFKVLKFIIFCARLVESYKYSIMFRRRPVSGSELLHPRPREIEVNHPLMRRKEVERMTTLSPSTIYRLMQEEGFPEPIKIGPRAVRWGREEIEEWLASRPRAKGWLAEMRME